MPRLLLIYAAIGRKQGKAFVRSWQMQPLAMARLAAMTPERWQITFQDDRVEPIDYSAEADLVGISLEAYSAKRAYQIAKRFRDRGVPVVLGGFHATLCPEEARQHADAVCVGEAEGVWQNILEDAEHKRLVPFYYGDRKRPLAGLEYERRIFKGKNYMPLALVETSRGCPFVCNFCTIAAAFRGTYRRRPVTEIVNELKEIKERYVFLVDDNILGDKAGAEELFEAITPLGIRWMSQASMHALGDESLIQKMAGSGCMGLLIGFESLDARNLEAMGKRINKISEYRATVGRLRQAGVFVYGTFVFGYPHDSAESFRQSVAFAKQEKLLIAAFNHLVPFPGTDLYRDLESAGALEHERWWLSESYRFGQVPFKPAALTSGEVETGCLNARKSFYTWSSIFRRSLDFQCNSGNPRRWWAYWMLNLMLKREISQKAGIPLGEARPEHD